eukprot:g8200.t1
MPEAMFAQHKSSSSSRQQPRRHRRRGAPGLLACSRSSDEIQRTTNTNVALSPVTGPGATSFSSVASAFDFQHHIGSDPASELLVLKQILTRECLLSRLEAVCDQLRKRFQLLPSASTAASDGVTAVLEEGNERIVDLLSKMRAATVAVIEAISVWRRDMTGHPPSAFVWHGDNYLLKITNDLNFLAGVQPLVNTLKMHPARFCRNPLMLPQTLDEQRRDGELHEESEDDNHVSHGAMRRRHLYQAAQVLLDEESLESERDLLRQESTKSPGAFPTRGDTSPELAGRHGFGAGGTGYGVRSCSTVPRGASQDICGGAASYSSGRLACGTGQAEDDDALRRHQRLSTWYEEARSQLVSLSTSPADEEYFLRSRRFWSKEELGDTGGGCSPPPPHRRHPAGTLTRGVKRSAFAAGAAVSGREATDGAQFGGTERLSDGEGSERADLFSERPANRHQRGLPPPRRTRRPMGPCVTEGQEIRTAGGSARQAQRGDDERGDADVWSRPDRFGGGSSAALSCLTVDDIEQVLREVDPLPATVAVCAAVVFLLSPEDQPPADFLWPQGFEAVALPVEDFLWRLHEASGGTASSTKARFLVPVLQREHLIPEEIERHGGHAVASLCAWALEELRACEEFAEWSEAALEPWYETQLIPTQPGAPESHEDVGGCEVRLVYKALHMLPNVGESYVISLFEDKGDGGGFIVRAFDRANRDAFWLSLTRSRVALFGENATRSPATLASTLARRLRLKMDGGSGKARLVLPSDKKSESSSEKKPKYATPSRVAKSSDDIDGQEEARKVADAGTTPPASPSPPLGEPATSAVSECPEAQARPRPPRRSHPPPMRGSMVEDLGPLVENGGNVNDCSAGELRGTRSLTTTGDDKDAAAVADGRVVEQSDEGSASEEILVKIEKVATAGELSGELQEMKVPQMTNDSAPAQTLSQTRSEQVASTTSGGVKRDGVHEPGMEESGSYAEEFTPDDDDDDGEDKGVGLGGEAGARVEEGGSYVDDFVDDGDDPVEARVEESGSYADDFVDNGDDPVEARVEESGSYADDFVDNGDDPAEARVEESGSYADDFVDDGDQPYEQDSKGQERGPTQQATENKQASDTSAARSGAAIATGSAEAQPTTGPADAPASERAVEGPSGTGRQSDDSPPEVQAREATAAQEGPPTEPQPPGGEAESTKDVDSNVERAAGRQLEEGYDDEFLEEGVEQPESAKIEAPESTQPVVSTEPEEPRPPQPDDADAEDDGASTSQAPQSLEDISVAKQTADLEQQAQPDDDDDGCQRSPGVTAHDLTVTGDTAAPEGSGSSGKVDVESVEEVAGHELLGNDSQGETVAHDSKNLARPSPLKPMRTLLVIDVLGNTRGASAHVVDALGNTRGATPYEGSAHKDYSEASTALKLAASKVASAAVEAAMESALELVSARDKGGATEIEAHDGSNTEMAEAEGIGKEEGFSAEVASPAATAQNDSSTTEPGQPVGEGATLTDETPDDCFEGSFEDDTDEIDAANSAGDEGTVASCSEFSSFVGETDAPPSLSAQDTSEGNNPGGTGGDQAEADSEVVETASAGAKGVQEMSTADYEDFEEDFDDDFDEDVGEEAPSGRPKQEGEVADGGDADSEILSGSEVVDATKVAAGGEEKPVEVPPVQEVIGNQDDDRNRGEERLYSIDVDQVAPPVARPLGDDVEDDFDDDDFEDP